MIEVPKEYEVWIGVHASSREAIVEHMGHNHEITEINGVTLHRTWIYPLEIKSPCGYRLDIRSEIDIPFKDYYCLCGNPDHIMVKYGKTGSEGKRSSHVGISFQKQGDW